MLKSWMAIVAVGVVPDAFSFTSRTSSSTSRLLFGPSTPTTASMGGTTSSGISRAGRWSSSSFRTPSISRLGFSIQNYHDSAIHRTSTTWHRHRHGTRRRRHPRMPPLGDASSSSSSESDDETTVGSSSSSIAVAADGGEETEELTTLRRENKVLHERLKLLQIQNDRLLERQKTDTDTASPEPIERPERKKTTPYVIEQRLILEDFEGEGMPSIDARGGAVDGWSRSERRYTEPWDDEGEADEMGGDKFIGPTSSSSEGEDYEDELGLAELKEDEVCEYDDETDKWTAGGVGECPVEPSLTFVDAMKSRAYWLVGLLALQSCSGFILSRNELLLQDHPVIVYFLTMLVGAGGNAGNQASVRVIRGLALGTLNPRTQGRFLNREFRMACALSAILSAAGFVRAVVFGTPLPETLAVTLALSMIVFSSICLGAVLPLLLQRAGVDPAHSSTTIQVVMDILGVVLTVLVSTMVLDSGMGKPLIRALGHMGF